MRKTIAALAIACAALTGTAHAAAPKAPGAYAYGNFQNVVMPPGTDKRKCDVYSRAAAQMVEMRNDGITYAVAFEDVNRIDVINEKIFMIMMLGAAYSKDGRTAWRDPRSADWSVMRKCTAWLYNNQQTGEM
ncbi:hypothetical protein [Burkholderia gladioli]|uniref:hypothetical protein n=1 Tax=Burkholderia gladioli TaxID=28095 RepID=UPI003D1FA958